MENQSENFQQSLLNQVILGVAHELNNPNAYIRMNTSNLKKLFNLLTPCLNEYEQNHPESKIGPFTLKQIKGKVQQHIESILEASTRMITIADKLKQCTSISLTQVAPLSLVDIWQRVLDMHQFLLSRLLKVELIHDHEDPCLVLGHQMQLEQAFSILITNASDALEEKFGEKTIEQATLKVEIIKKSQMEYLIEISDNGCGMSPEIMEKIFSPYFTTKPQGVGDGLGLALCKSLLLKHGGEINVSSQKGEWTKFSLTLKRNI